MRLTDRLSDSVFVGDVEIPINLAFDVVLRAYELKADKRLSRAEKIEIYFDMFAADEGLELDFLEKSAAVSGIFKIIDRREDGSDPEPHAASEKGESEENSSKPIYDFDKDAERIYASFLYDYGIDLYAEQGRLHWFKFLALFANLSEQSPEGQAIYYRTVKLPPANKYNKDDIKYIKAKKAFYALDAPQTEAEKVAAARAQMERIAAQYEKARR